MASRKAPQAPPLNLMLKLLEESLPARKPPRREDGWITTAELAVQKGCSENTMRRHLRAILKKHPESVECQIINSVHGGRVRYYRFKEGK